MRIDRHMAAALALVAAAAFMAVYEVPSDAYYLLMGAVGLAAVSLVNDYAVEGVKGLAARLGVSDYVGGVISSLASNLPEAVLALFMAAHPELREIAVLTVLLAATFNGFLLGLLIVLLSRRNGRVEIPREALIYDMEVMRITTVFAMLIAFAAIMFALQGANTPLPPEAALLMLAAYLAYTWFISRAGKREGGPRGGWGWAAPFALGIAGIILGSELLSGSVEHFASAGHLSYGIVATILAFAGSVPEHFVAVSGGLKGEVDIGVSNLVSGIVQTVMVIFPLLSLVVPLKLDGFVVYQLLVAALTLWLTERSITDDSVLTLDEGISIMLANLLALLLFDELSLRL